MAILFLVADTQLYKRLCPSVGRLVGRSVSRSVGRSVGWSVEVIESKSGKTRISAPAHPSATGGRISGLVSFRVVIKTRAGWTDRRTNLVHLTTCPRLQVDFNVIDQPSAHIGLRKKNNY